MVISQGNTSVLLAKMELDQRLVVEEATRVNSHILLAEIIVRSKFVKEMLNLLTSVSYSNK